MTPRTSDERGFALVFVLWVTALLAILAASFLHENGTEAKIARNQYERARARTLADTGVSLAIIELFDRNPQQLHLDGSARDLGYTGGTIRLRLQDEAGKLNLNHASEEVLANLLRIVAPNTSGSSNLAAAIAAWRERRSAQWRGPAGSGQSGTSGPFLAVEELLEVAGMTRGIYDRLSPFVTVLSQTDRVDPASAPREVLLSLPGAQAGEVAPYVAARGRSGSDAGMLPPLTGLDRYLFRQAAPQAVSIDSEARISPTVTFVREATVSLLRSPGRPFRFVDWRQGASAMQESAGRQ